MEVSSEMEDENSSQMSSNPTHTNGKKHYDDNHRSKDADTFTSTNSVGGKKRNSSK